MARPAMLATLVAEAAGLSTAPCLQRSCEKSLGAACRWTSQESSGCRPTRAGGFRHDSIAGSVPRKTPATYA
ncbi:hypothetical protein [Streptomyces sp. NPDC057696]|uniref:hypothetical protein n=1 Tax=Streptomyces sp. NPDC057696 TaxID=3346218 RepID=UPI00367BBD69